MSEEVGGDAPGAAAAGAARRVRRGPAPIASFDHDVSDESSPEAKATFQLPEIREHRAASPGAGGAGGAGSSGAAGALAATSAAPRIDISRASSSSHHDSRDSSPEMFAAAGDGERGLGFREDGALELRSSTEELAFLEPAETQTAGRSTRGNSIGSACSVRSSTSRAPSPHRVLRETSFCGPKPLSAEDEPRPHVAERALRRPELQPEGADRPADRPAGEPARPPDPPAPQPHRLLTHATVEPPARRSSAPAPRTPAPPQEHDAPPPADLRPEPRRRPRRRSEMAAGDEPVVYRSENRDKSVIRIRLKPDDQYEDDDDDNDDRPSAIVAPAPAVVPGPAPARSLAPSPSPSRRSSPNVSRKSSFCSLFRRSPEPPAPPPAPRARSKSRDRSTTPPTRARGSVLALFRPAPRRSAAPSPAPASPSAPPPRVPPAPGAESLRYYEDSADGVIHIPLHSPPEERAATVVSDRPRAVLSRAAPASSPVSVPVSAPSATVPTTSTTTAAARVTGGRTVLPDGSVIIPLRSPTEETPPSPRTLASRTAGAPRTPPATGAVGADRPEEWRGAGPTETEFAFDFSRAGAWPDGSPQEDAGWPAGSPQDAGSPDREIMSYMARHTPPDDDEPTTESDACCENDHRPYSYSDSGEESPEEPDRRLLVVDSDEELPFVATTLPQERPLALPMRSMGAREPSSPHASQATRRPRARSRRTPEYEWFEMKGRDRFEPRLNVSVIQEMLPHPPLSIYLPPHRGMGTSAMGRPWHPRPQRPTWFNVSTAPERRAPPRVIQVVPAPHPVAYVEPAECRCECHQAGGAPPAEDELPLLRDAAEAAGLGSDPYMLNSSMPESVTSIYNQFARNLYTMAGRK